MEEAEKPVKKPTSPLSIESPDTTVPRLQEIGSVKLKSAPEETSHKRLFLRGKS
jgi:hypothetical protein